MARKIESSSEPPRGPQAELCPAPVPSAPGGVDPRFACVLIPALPLQAVLRAQPALRGLPVAVLSRSGVVLHATPNGFGVQSGMTATQAQAACPALKLCTPSFAALASAEGALWDVAAKFSQQVERGADHVLLEVGDLRSPYPAAQELAEVLRVQALSLDLTAQVAVAGGPDVARLLARACHGVTVVVPGQERGALASLPAEALELPRGLLELLRQRGVWTIGDFAALPRRDLAARLGAEGVRLHRLAHGEDPRPLLPTAPRDYLSEAIDLDEGVINQDVLAEHLGPLLDRLLARLGVRGLACGDYLLRLALDSPAGMDEHTFHITPATRDAETLLTLARQQLQLRPPQSTVRRLSVVTALPSACSPLLNGQVLSQRW